MTRPASLILCQCRRRPENHLISEYHHPSMVDDRHERFKSRTDRDAGEVSGLGATDTVERRSDGLRRL
jgi:hypothetical protein